MRIEKTQRAGTSPALSTSRENAVGNDLDSRPGPSTEPRDTENLVRLLARVCVGAGGLFWIIAAFTGPYVFDNTSLSESMHAAMWPFLATVAILVVGWFYEQLAAILLTAASGAVLVWGVIYGWEPGLWVVMVLVLMGPMMLAATLFVLASRAEELRAESAKIHGPVKARVREREIESQVRAS
jgi:hypothetical protein